MSKKKNTLKDLDEFLKQQAASLVPPEPVTVPPSPPENVNQRVVTAPGELTHARLLAGLQALAGKNPNAFRQEFYDLIIKTLESFPTTSPEDKMLINTTLYLKSGDGWKEVIREYWKKHS